VIEKENLQILFVPTVPESDYALSKYVRNLMKNKNKCYVVNTKFFDCTEVKLLLGQMCFLISMRIHATILAGSNNVPSLSILPSHDFKSVGIMNDLGLSDYFLNLMDLSSTRKLLPTTVKLLHNNLDNVVYSMKERTPTIKSRAESAARMLDYVL
jgi:polysaccharide pyruvyl transferase WcaK-like protein